MTKPVVGLLVAASIVVGSASAAITRTYYLNFGDTAATNGGDVQCKAILKNNHVSPGPGSSGFRCYTGGDYRGTYGFILTSYKVSFIRYTGMNTYKILWTKNQTP